MRRALISAFFLICFCPLASTQSALLQVDSFLQHYQFEQAIEFVDQYMEAHPNRKYDKAEALWYKGNALLKLEQLDQATVANEASQAIYMEIGSDDFPKNYLLKSKIALAKGELDAALAIIRQAEEFPVNSILLVELIFQEGLIYKNKGEFETATEKISDALSILDIEGIDLPLFKANAYLTLAKIYMEEEREDQVNAQFDQLVGLILSEEEAQTWLIRELSTIFGPKPTSFWLWPLGIFASE